MVIIRRDESDDGEGEEERDWKEEEDQGGSCNDTPALERGQTAPLNYRLMKTLREMKSLSDDSPAGERRRWVVECPGPSQTCMANRIENCRSQGRFPNFSLPDSKCFRGIPLEGFEVPT